MRSRSMGVYTAPVPEKTYMREFYFIQWPVLGIDRHTFHCVQCRIRAVDNLQSRKEEENEERVVPACRTPYEYELTLPNIVYFPSR